MIGNHPEQAEAVPCIYKEREFCPVSCPIYSVAKWVQEVKQQPIDEVRRELLELGLSEEFISETEFNIKNYPIGLGRTVKFWGLQLSDCMIYFRNQLSKIDPNAH